MATVAARKPELDSMGVQVLAASTNSHFIHKIWQEEELSKMVEGGFPYPMLFDAGGKIGTLYDVYEEEGGGGHSRPLHCGPRRHPPGR